MEHSLYRKLELITEKLANEKGCMVKDPTVFQGDRRKAIWDREIPFGKDKGKIQYYDAFKAMDYKDFIERCFAILPRDNLAEISDDFPKKETGVSLETLLSDKPCSEEEKTRQKLVIYNFFQIADAAGVHGLTESYYDSKTGEKKFAYCFSEPIPTTYKKVSPTKTQGREPGE